MDIRKRQPKDLESQFGSESPETKPVATIAGQYPLYENLSPYVGRVQLSSRMLMDELAGLEKLVATDSDSTPGLEKALARFREHLNLCRSQAVCFNFNGYPELEWLGLEPKTQWSNVVSKSSEHKIGGNKNHVQTVLSVAKKLTRDELLEYGFIGLVGSQANGRGVQRGVSMEHWRRSYGNYNTAHHDLNDNLLFTLTSNVNLYTGQSPTSVTPLLFDPELIEKHFTDMKILAGSYLKRLQEYAADNQRRKSAGPDWEAEDIKKIGQIYSL